MSNKLFISCLFIISLCFASLGHANNRTKFCPSIDKIRYESAILTAFNSDHKPFVTGTPCSYCVPPDYPVDIKILNFRSDLTTYEPKNKILRCYYEVREIYSNGKEFPELTYLYNFGDY